MFSKEHFIWIGLCIIFIGVILRISIKKKMSLKVAGYIMTGICLISELSKIMSDMVISPYGKGMVLDARSLPFHLCSLMIFMVPYITFSNNEKVKQKIINFVAVAGTIGGICAILIPTNGTDFLTIFAYQCFVYHAGLVWFSLYLIVSKRAKLGGKTIFSNMFILLCLSFMNIYINGALSNYNTNFMYIVRPPMENLPFLNLDKGWYVYILRLFISAITLLSLFHLPFIISERRRTK